MAQLREQLAEVPQDLPVFIYDADENCLLILEDFLVRREMPDTRFGYSFERVELGGDYHSALRVKRDVDKVPASHGDSQ